VEISGEVKGQNPCCACGEIMRKKYVSPVFTYLDFLRSDRRLTPPHVSPQRSLTRAVNMFADPSRLLSGVRPPWLC